MRTLRWRLLLTYVGVLAMVLLILGLVLNTAISRALYAEDQARLTGEATAAVALGQRGYERLINGRSGDCAGAISYQQAFDQAIASPLTAGHPAISAVYLVDQNGSVLAPEAGPVAVGSAAPDLSATRLAQVNARIAAARRFTGFGPIPQATISYNTTGGSGQRIAVTLIAVRYRSVSQCADALNASYGIVEVITTYDATRVALARIQLLLLMVLGGALVAGIAIGGPLIAGALRPLARMSQVAGRIAQGDLTQRVRLPHGGDEIGQLADTFDEMVSRIEQAFAAQHASEERMRQFIADASHELRTPLTSIRGYTDVLLRGAKDDPETAEQVLITVRREAERMSRLVNDLLTLARLDAGRPLELRRVDLAALAGEAVDQARLLAGEREVTMRSEADHLAVYADPDRLKQVLLILLDNALKYGRQDAGGWVRVRLGRSQCGVFVSVSDNGRGISAEDLPHVFDRFYRAQRAAQRRMTNAHTAARATGSQPAAGAVAGPARAPTPEGSGLGLPIALAILRAHGSTLSAESQLGAGSTFTMELPLPPAGSAPPPSPMPGPSSAPSARA
ncbi:MAG TPA: ATP-binding protein [Ktedonobacterales bacterium]|nr:ATP-binding protein [Ktedonobacterales bacterium]